MAGVVHPLRQRLQRFAHRQPELAHFPAIRLTKLVIGQTGGDKIIFRSLRPGPVSTTALDKLGLSAQALGALQKEIKNRVPLGRMGTQQELAKAALLASDESSYVVGSELLVDGGTGNLSSPRRRSRLLRQRHRRQGADSLMLSAAAIDHHHFVSGLLAFAGLEHLIDYPFPGLLTFGLCLCSKRDQDKCHP
ncbi:3-oxoacyl-[acyl-carrier-protein] reductase FabG [Raoultella terrigena]|nr:3-oxoacyl-[acyl-carrier-protein] reductase FabG [Raoultella terrigena]